MSRVLSLAIALVMLSSLSAEAQVTLKHKNPENTTTTTTVKTETKQVLTIAGMDIDTNASQTIVAEGKSGARADDGTIELHEKVKSMIVDATYPGGSRIQYDSSKENTPTGTQFDFMIDLLDVLSATESVIKLDRNNRCLSIKLTQEGLDDLPEESQAIVAGQMDTEYLVSAQNLRFKEIPATPLKAGDSWMVEFPMRLGGGQSLEMDRKMVYKGQQMTAAGRKLHVLSGEVTAAKLVQDADSESPVKISGSELTVKSSTIQILFDNQMGRIVRSTSKIHVAGDIKLDINGMELPGNLDLSLNISTSVR